MTRKDYELIAAAISAAHTHVNASTTLSTPQQGIGIAVSYLAEALADDNPRFDSERFIAACAPLTVIEFYPGIKATHDAIKRGQAL